MFTLQSKGVCESPNNRIHELTLDLQEHGSVKAFYGPNGDLYFVWPVNSDPPFEFDFDSTGDLYFRDVYEDGTLGELRYIGNIVGKEGEVGPPGIPPKIIGGFWYVYDDDIQDYVNSGIPLNTAPYLNEDTGSWFFFDFQTLSFVDTRVVGRGQSPKILDDFWYFFDDDTNKWVKSKYQLNTAPYIDDDTGNWWAFNYQKLEFEDTGVVGVGFHASSPIIEDDYWWYFDDTTKKYVKSDYRLNTAPIIKEDYWWFFDDNRKEYVKSDYQLNTAPFIDNEGFWNYFDFTTLDFIQSDYTVNTAPYIDKETGNWFQYDSESLDFVDTGVHAKGDRCVIPNVKFKVEANGDLHMYTESEPILNFELDEDGNLYYMMIKSVNKW